MVSKLKSSLPGVSPINLRKSCRICALIFVFSCESPGAMNALVFIWDGPLIGIVSIGTFPSPMANFHLNALLPSFRCSSCLRLDKSKALEIYCDLDVDRFRLGLDCC